MVRSSGFGSIRSDRSRPIQTRFRSGFGRFRSLTKPLPISRQSILPKVRSQVIRLSYRLSAYGFMFYFTPRQGFSFTFPSRYLFAIGHSGVFSLTRWSSLIHTGFHVPHATRDKKNKSLSFSVTGLSPSMVQDSAASPKLNSIGYQDGTISSHDPKVTSNSGLGWSRFARRYSGNRVCFLLLWLLRCFNSPGCLYLLYEFKKEFYRLPYSGIFDSQLVSSSSKHFVGFHALHRL
jgi:hypothetical protein